MRRRLKRWMRCLCSGALVFLSTSHALSDNRARLEIVGTLRARVELESSEGAPRIHGRVEDELGRPVAGAEVVVPGHKTWACDGAAAAVSAQDGTFCAQAEAKTQVESVRIEASGFDTVILPLHDQLTRTGLEISYAPHIVDLEIERPESVTVRHPRTDPTDLELVLEDAREGTVLVRSQPAESGQTDLTFYPSELKTPGRYSLFVRQGSTRSKPQSLLVRAKVALSLVAIARERQTLHVSLSARTGQAPAQSGRIELTLSRALLGQPKGDPVSSSELGSGRAHFEVPRGERDFEASFAYIPLSPEYLAGPPLLLEVPRRETILPGWWLHVLLLSLFLFWFQKRWRREPRAEPPPNGPVAAIIRQAEEHSLPGVRGTVVDAHTQEPQFGAKVNVLALTASGESLVGQALTDEAGQFTVPISQATAAPLAVQVEQHGYRTLRGPVTHGLLRIQIIERRRGALMDLVRWARRTGSGWREARAPTPLEVAKQSHAEGQSERAEWAAQVNVEAFGADEPKRPPLDPPRP